MAVGYSRSMVGGDIGGLAALATQLRTYPPQMQSVVDTLKSRVERLVSDAGWWGDAATSFKMRWEADAIRTELLLNVIYNVAAIVGTLSTDLRIVENDLQQSADVARAAGVPIADTGEMLDLPPGADPALIQAAANYSDARLYLMQVAQDQRLTATANLQQIEGIIGPPQQDVKLNSQPPDAGVTVADFMMGLYAVPAGADRYLRDQLPALRAAREAALQNWRVERDIARATHTKISPDIRAAHKSTLAALNQANAELDSVDHWDTRLARMLDYNVGDVARLLGGAEADGRALKLFSDVPVVDIVAAAVSTGLLSYDDMQKGDDWTAIPKEASAQVAGIAAGVVAGAAAGALVVGGAALIGVSAPVVAVVAVGVIVGAVVAVGVGDTVSEAWHEHWDEDIHQYGVVGGIGYGVKDVLGNTGHDMVKLASAAGGVKDAVVSGAQNIWHGIFG